MATLIEEARTDGLPHFQLKERGPSGKIAPSPPRDECFPVYFVEPLSGSDHLIGLDLASEPAIAPVLELARDTTQLLATCRVELPGPNGDQAAFRLMLPVYSKGESIRSVDERRRHLVGFYSAIHRLDEFVGRSLAQDLVKDIDFYIFDNSLTEGDPFLYASSAPTRGSPPMPSRSQSVQLTGLHASEILEVGGREWLVIAKPTPGFLASHHTWQAEMTLAGGLLATLLLTGYVVIIQRGAIRSRRFAAEQLRSKQELEREISERKKTGKALRESEEKYRTLFEQSRDAILIVAKSGRIIDANGSCGELFGAPRDEIVGASILDFYEIPEEREEVRRQIERHGFVMDWECQIRGRDTIKRVCLLTSSLWKQENGAILGYLTIARDVTVSKRLEEQLQQAQKMEALGTIAGGIAHDFNNLLQVIKGYADMALMAIENGEQWCREFREIRNAATSAAELTKGLLTFSRRVESNLRPVDINTELLLVARMLERTIPKMIRIEMNLANGLPAILADPAQLQQALLNLAVNARDSMPDGGTLTIATREADLDGCLCTLPSETNTDHCVLIAVSDNGSGMDERTVERIFDPFFTTKEAGKGTGLGLSIVYGIVKNHSGSIQCTSQPGQGTTFRICLPATNCGQSDGEPETHRNLATGTETILLVDDEDPVRKLGSDVLKKFGYDVLTATNGREGLELYTRNKDSISLCILDLVMPEMGGKECLERILDIDPNAKVLIVSGYASDGSIEDAVEHGAKGSLRKPYGVSELLESVRQILDGE